MSIRLFIFISFFSQKNKNLNDLNEINLEEEEKDEDSGYENEQKGYPEMSKEPINRDFNPHYEIP